MPDVCYALKIGITGVETVFLGGTEYRLLFDVCLVPAEYSARWRVDAVEDDKYCFVHPLMGKLKLPKADFPELKVDETIVLRQVVDRAWWASEYFVSYQFEKK